MLKQVAISFLLMSCTSAAKDWSDWREESIRIEKRKWDFCHERLHGPEFHMKGFCYVSQECRTRKTIFKNEKKECRKLRLFCKWGDIDCYLKYDILSKRIM